MIRKLKIKFILTNMTLITFVMIAAFVLLYLNTAYELEENSINALHDIAYSTHGGAEALFDRNNTDTRETKYPYISTYIIDLDTRNNTCYVDGFGDVENMTDEQIEHINSLIRTVGEKNTVEGILEEFNLRYYCVETSVGMRIVLLDKRYEDDNLHHLLMSFLTSGSIAFTAFLIISVVVAGIAVKPVEKSMKQQKQLISDISHELKTPITVITTNTDIILSHEEATVNEEKKWLGYIKDEATRMSDLVNMMLYLAKTDEASAKPQLCEIDLSSIAYEIALPFESVCFENDKTFNINIESDIAIKGEASSIKQLMVILLDNAVKYSNDKGRIELNIKRSGDKALLSVFNTGEPIPKESIPFIFDRFYRIDKARSREKGGSGLGLSIAKRIIENNEANISVSSDLEHGTVFTCTFDFFKNKKKDKSNNQFS